MKKGGSPFIVFTPPCAPFLLVLTVKLGMGTILQNRVQLRFPERVSIREREWKKGASWSNNGPNVASNNMGRRQSQRRSAPQPQHSSPSQENNEKRLQQRRKHKPNTPPTKHYTPQHSAQEASESKYHPLSPAGDRMEPKVQPAAQRCTRREHRHAGVRGSGHKPAFPRHHLSNSSLDLLEKQLPNAVSLSGRGEGDSDTDLSDSERLLVSPPGRAPPQLELRPEVIETSEDCSFRSHRPRRRGSGGFDFPDFLPPPFNSWSLSQLAVFYNAEGRGSPWPGLAGPLERYLERLLKLEWHQIQTVQEESGKSAVSDVISGCNRSLAAASSRLSSPKCILQCQRAFPLTFLSSVARQSALLSNCACPLCHIRVSACSASCCRSARQSRLRPTPECSRPAQQPKRSYSESRVRSSDWSSASQAHGFSSSVRTNSHQRRMQASGNIRNPVQGANTTPRSTARDSSLGVWSHPLRARGDVLNYRLRKRTGSEQGRGGVERQQAASEKRRSGSECRRGGAEWRAAGLKEREIKPDAATAILDNLPGSKNDSMNRPNRPKQVEFVT